MKAREVTRSAKLYSIFGSCAAIMLAPLTGGAGLTTIFSEAGQLVANEWLLPVPGADVGVGIASAGLVLGGEPGAKGQLTSSLTNILSALLPEDTDPLLKDAIKAAAPKAADLALSVFVSGTPAGAAIGAGGASALSFLDLSAIVPGALSQAVGLLVGAVKGAGVKRVADFHETVLDLANLPGKMAPWLMWCAKILGVDLFLQAVLKGLFGIDVDVLDLLGQRAEADGVPVPAGLRGRGAAASARTKAVLKAAVGIGGGSALLFGPLLLGLVE